MSALEIILAVSGVNVVTVVGAAWALSGRMSRMETKLEHAASGERVAKVETTQEEHGRRLDRHDELFGALFEHGSADRH